MHGAPALQSHSSSELHLHTSPAAPNSKPTRAGTVDWVLLALALVVLVVIPKSVSGDGRLRYEVLEQFANTGRLVSPKYSTVGPLLSSPLYFLGRALGAPRAVTALFNPLLFLTLLLLLWREFRSELAPALRRTLLFLLVFASMFANHVQFYYGEVFTTVAVTVGVLFLSRGAWARGWALIVLGAINTPAALIGVLGIAICDARRTRRFWPLLAPLFTFACTRLESLLVRGHAFDTGYSNDAGFRTALPYSGLPNFSYPFFFGLLAIFLSFGKGLLFYAPGLFLPLPASATPRVRWVHHTLIAFVAGLVIIYARWWSWYGGWFWGPRFFLAASLPACFSLAYNLYDWQSVGVARRALIALVLLLSFWVGVNGLAFQQVGLGLCTRNNYQLEAFCHFVPEMSALWHPFVDGGAAHPPVLRVLAFVAVGFWFLALAWLGRRLFFDLAQTAYGALRRWRTWW